MRKTSLYTLCKHCDHFVDPNDCEEPGLAKFIHLEDGEQEFDHEAEPEGVALSLCKWKKRWPDLFMGYPDGKIGPNSRFAGRRGKIDS